MKRLLFILFALLPSIGLCQWVDPAPSGGNIYYNGGNVGIGISNPLRNLHVRGSSSVLQIDRNSDSPGVGITRYSSDWSTIYKSFHIATASQAEDNGQFQIIDWHQQTAGDGDVRFVIDNIGRIGIGTQFPGKHSMLMEICGFEETKQPSIFIEILRR